MASLKTCVVWLYLLVDIWIPIYGLETNSKCWSFISWIRIEFNQNPIPANYNWSFVPIIAANRLFHSFRIFCLTVIYLFLQKNIKICLNFISIIVPWSLIHKHLQRNSFQLQFFQQRMQYFYDPELWSAT